MPTTTQMMLPQTKDPKEFESICKDVLNVLYKLQPVSGFDKYGRTGQNQHGIDLYVKQSDGLIVAQCKNYTIQNKATQLIGSIREDLASISKIDNVVTVIIMTSHRTDSTVQNKIMTLGSNYSFNVTVIFWDSIEEILCDMQNSDIFVKHFPTYVRNIGSLHPYNPNKYRINSQTQFDYWKASQGKLYNVLHEDDEYIPMKIKNDNYECAVEDILTKLKETGCRHAILTGDGGMGKTTTCLRLWDICLKQNIQVFYVPLCDYSSTNTIHRRIINVYDVEENNYNRLMTEEDVVLLFDGFNEMKNEYIKNFFTELKELTMKKRVLICITSRNDVIDIATNSFTRFTFKPIDKENIANWLEKHSQGNKETKLTPELYSVLGNPMLLKIYALKLNLPEKINNKQLSNFLENPVTTGEIIWNFLEHQIILKSDSQKKGHSANFLFRWLLPYIAYKIEIQEKFHFTRSELKKYVDEFVTHVNNLNETPDDLILYETEIQTLCNLGETETLLNLFVDYFGIIELQPIEKVKGDTYTFIHEYFRDIFSATHIKNQMKLQDKPVFTNRVLPFHVSQMLLEILQEHKADNSSKLREYLKCFKKEVGSEAQIGVFNALQIIEYARKGDMSAEDFSELDLRMCTLAGKNICKSKFINSYISTDVLFSRGHTSIVWWVCFSPYGKHIATASKDGVRVWECETGKLVHTLQESSGHTSKVCFSSDGKHIATASKDGVRVWECETGKLVRTLQTHPDLVKNVALLKYVVYVRFSSDGKHIATILSDGDVKIWAYETGERSYTQRKFSHIVYNQYFSSDGKHIATASSDGDVIIWETGERSYTQHTKFLVQVWEYETGKLACTLQEHIVSLDWVCFSSDGKYLATRSYLDGVKVWEHKTGKLVRTIEDSRGLVCFSSDGKYLATRSYLDGVKVWEHKTGKLVRTIEDSRNLLCFSPDGKHIATASKDGDVRVWECETGKLVHTLQDSTDVVSCVCFSPDGKYLATSRHDVSVKVWENKTGKLVHTLQGYTCTVRHVCFNPDGKYIAIISDDNIIRVFETKNFKLNYLIDDYLCSVHRACFSPDGKHLAAASEDGVKVWEHKTSKLVRTIEDSRDRVSWVCFSPDGKYLATNSYMDIVRVWEYETGKLVHTLQNGSSCDTGAGGCVCFSPDGKHLAAALGDGVVKVWEYETGKLVHTLQNGSSCDTGAGGCVCFSPDGKHLATISPSGVKVWEHKTSKLVRTIEDSRDLVCFSPDGKYLATNSYGDIVRVWEYETGKLVHTLQAHTDFLWWVCFSPDGKYIATASVDGSCKVWENESWQLIETIYALAHVKFLGADFRGIQCDNLTEDDIRSLKQHGAITDWG